MSPHHLPSYIISAYCGLQNTQTFMKEFSGRNDTCLQSLLLFQQIQLLNDVIHLFLQLLNSSIVCRVCKRKKTRIVFKKNCTVSTTEKIIHLLEI